jgi:uracil permease
VGGVTGQDYLKKPGLHRTLLGDGLATSAAGLFGGPPNTTYAEVTGAVMLTKNYNPKIMTWAAVIAITLAFVGKFGAILQSIPVPVMGGILCLLFGTIASVGMNTLIRHKVDLSEARNLVIVSVTLVFGIGGVLIGSGTGPDDIGLKGIALCAIVAIVLNLLLPGNDGWRSRITRDGRPFFRWRACRMTRYAPTICAKAICPISRPPRPSNFPSGSKTLPPPQMLTGPCFCRPF